MNHLDLPSDGTFHRALADAEMTSALWLRLLDLLAERGPRDVTFSDMVRLCQTSKADLSKLVDQLCHA